MSEITLSIPDPQMAQLAELAHRLGITPEDLVRYSIEDLLLRPEETFQQAADYVLSKNQGLYKRLS